MVWIKQSVMTFNFTGCENPSVESYTEDTRDTKDQVTIYLRY